ncbi:TonB-dependent receptor plug domain-containing protein [Pelomonas sp. SE-A7]|uniref:TonB-dependent receptor n=1 Tax=Pelomonas sp. SE-A7 TaxID=3054953 RepID=UPI00259D0E3F|nr:TonB-dependent receptor plug domain-containing protein [Pelomonas sp. SE-A7]MDM4768497.1 TonB-dependent receptor plug domain-containing protein [Pelomonas sp. SE-A7]
MNRNPGATPLNATALLRRSAVAVAVGLALASGSVVHAQTSATGTILGSVKEAGTTVVIENVDTGAKRTLTPGTDGKFTATSMPVGRYKVVLMRGAAVLSTRNDVDVSIGTGTEVSFTAAALETVQVTGRKQVIDVSSAGSTTTFSARELEKLPVANNVGAVIQLAPQTVRGDSRYGGAAAPSFGGAGASENAYYINGFPVTTILTQVGFSQLPFNSIAQAQLLTGGYGSEFGRSTGGVVNIVTKSGGNDFVAGGAIQLEPSSFRAKAKNTYYGMTGNNPNTDGKMQVYNAGNMNDTRTVSVYAGGPIIKDKLFFFAAGEDQTATRSLIRQANTGGTGTANAVLAGGWQEADVNKRRALLKLDWNITDEHHLEYTKIFDRIEDSRRYYSFDYNTLQRGSAVTGGADYVNWGPTPVAAEQGSSVDILKYTGYLTDDLTVTALIGKTSSPHKLSPLNYNPNIPQVVLTTTAPGLNYPVIQTTTGNLLVPGAKDENKGARLDFEWRANSQHTLRAGIDYNKINSVAGSSRAGGSTWTYSKTDPTVPVDRYSVALNTVAGNALAAQGYYASQVFVATTSTPTVIQSAAYIEDKWQITKNVLLELGLRNEAFDNRNGDNKSYIKLATQIAPRLGASWDVNGDASFKVYTHGGRYHVPLPTNVAVRGAGSSLFTTRNYAYTGVDQTTGAPTGLTAISPTFSNNNEFGQAKDPRTVAAQDMKGNYQDEILFGFDKNVSKSLTLGAKFTYRALKTAIDDFCDDRPFLAWAAKNKVDASHWGFNCALFNPGRANSFMVDFADNGTLTKVDLSAADLGFPKVKRTYTALDLTAEYPFDGKFWAKVNYTWSKNKGNTEGQLLSDIGQADVATTQVYDFPDFSVNSDGLLPNHRTHSIKAFGLYQMTSEFGIGVNTLLASGRPKNCIGNAPADPVKYPNVTNYSGYGSAYFFCKGVPAPRGTFGKLPWDTRLDLNFVYKPEVLKGFAFKVDIFNVFNNQTIETIEERYNAAGGSTNIRNTYGSVQSYSAPKSVKFTASYDYKF